LPGWDGFEHYNGSAAERPDDAGSRVIWIVDVLPEQAAKQLAAMRDFRAPRRCDTVSRATLSHDADAGGPTGGPVAR
jgi:hypothetical protein